MTQEDKELLFKDLSARLPYGVKISYDNKIYLLSIPYLEDIKNIALGHEHSRGYNIKNISIKPYLRSMSSMTEEEKKEYKTLCIEETFTFATWQKIKWYDTWKSIDWLNKHHFDYRGLIEKGLALEAPEGMYK